MNKLRRLLLSVLLLIIFIISVAFSLWNTTPVPLSLGLYTLEPQPLSMWVVTALCLGGIVGLLIGAGFFQNLKMKFRLRGCQKKLNKLQQELHNIRQENERLRRETDEGECDAR